MVLHRTLLFLLPLFRGARSHVEDYVLQEGTGTVCNFYESSAALECKQDERSPSCDTASVVQGSETFAEVSNFRGVVHYDGVFILAQAVGFSAEMAYWLAAFAQSADFVQFQALDSCGLQLPIEYWTPPLRGYLRTSTQTGGTVRHLGIPFGLVKPSATYTGLTPDLYNFDYEGTLSAFRLWGRGERDVSCHGGFREPVDGNYFVGDTCLTYPTTLWSEGVSNAVKGPIPLSGSNLTFGNQIAHYDCENDPTCNGTELTLINIVYATELADYIESRQEAKLEDGSTVPELITRMGIYMHMLADRASHYYCTDVNNTGVYLRDDGIFDTILDNEGCNFVYHSQEHYWEQAVEHPLAEQSYAALKLYYDELLSFRELVEPDHPEWFVRDPDAYDNLVGTDANRGPIDSAFVIVDGQDRMNAVLNVMDTFGYSRPPGFEEGSNACCPEPKEFIQMHGPELPSPSQIRVGVAKYLGISSFCVVVLTGEQYTKLYGESSALKKGRKGSKKGKNNVQEEWEVAYLSLSSSCVEEGGGVDTRGLYTDLVQHRDGGPEFYTSETDYSLSYQVRKPKKC